MAIQFVLLPLFVEVALTFGLLFWHGASRAAPRSRASMSHGRHRAWASRTGRRARSSSLTASTISSNLPVLFYVLTILSIITHHADLVVRGVGLDFRVFRLCTPMCT